MAVAIAITDLIFLIILTTIPFSISQPTEKAPPPTADSCNGIFLSYSFNQGAKLPPNLTVLARQPYRFESTLSILNNGLQELKSWKVFVGFQHDEFLVSASGAVLADGNSIPGNVGNGTVFGGFPMSNLKTAIETAGDFTQMQVQVKLLGTQFGVAPPNNPMPSNISLANDGYLCTKPILQGKSEMHVCCSPDPRVKTNITTSEEFLARQNGDLTIMYDVTRTYDSSYWAQVTISNHNPLGRLDYWKLSWDWMRDEFIYSMKGAYPSVVDFTECIFGRQGTYYRDLDFFNVLSCKRRPTIVDLPPTKANDTTLGSIPFCCRNGTILPSHMDPSKSVSAFQIQVFKMPPDLNRSQITPPQNWQISGVLNPTYKCGQPVRVSPSEFPDSSGLLLNSTAVASWQIVCNITHVKKDIPKCCVSFSSYYNESVIPCRTCACGCSLNSARTCNATSPAMLLPAEALLVPFENRTAMAVAWAGLKHFPVPNPMPCSDNCGVSINWHLYTDYRNGWSARITLFNWGEVSFADWFAAVQMNKAAPGFQAMYSFNATTLELDGSNSTIFMQGHPGLNYLVGETDGVNPAKDLRVPGKQQSVISFTKKNIQGLNMAAGDGFPTKVFFNGEECLLPKILPANNIRRNLARFIPSILMIGFVFLFIQQ
ncbi:COBRA-like protein 7 [Cucurbita moschata]|uniref:COBRA-like protein 7 n=1 Tax=Cucurbita moschata TaxID=3662 RepID=A0A6J1GVF1_CUCMO|nr:COBRA-like protein 7 [Cucurbita moschata]